MILNPIAAVLALTRLLRFLLIFEENFICVNAFFKQVGRNLSWMLVLDGVITVILGILMMSPWPIRAVWLIGLCVSISILSGILLLVICPATRRAATQSE